MNVVTDTEEGRAYLRNLRLDALESLRQASRDVVRVSTELQRELAETIDRIRDGQHLPDPSNQRPFDLARAIERRRQAVEACHRAGCSGDTIQQAARGL